MNRRPPKVPSEDTIVARFVSAYEAADPDAVVALLTDDVFMSMPPMPLEYEGRDVVARFCAGVSAQAAGSTSCRRGPTASRRFAAYLSAPAGIRRGTGLIVLTLTGDRICAMTRFETSVFPWFGMPRSLPSR